LLGGFKGNAEKNVTETGNLSTSPDKLEFDFNDVLPVGSNLYFREAYFPYWKAEFVSPQGSQDVPVMRAGPGFMFMVLPQVQSGDKVILQIKESLLQDILNITSVITLICLFIYLFFPGVVYGVEKYLSGFNLTPKIKIKMPEFIGSMSSDEENY